MRMLIPSALILQIAIAAGCGESPSALEAQRAPEPPRPAISDAAHGGRDGFYFLPPLVPEPEFDGVFDPLWQPVVQICELAGDACPVLAEYTLLSGPDSVTVQVDPLAEHYNVDWHTDRFSLTDGVTYHIRVLVEGRIVGTVDVVRVGTDLESTATGEVIPLENGTTLPIRFRIEVELRLGAIVPATTPDSAPDWLYDYTTSDSPVLSGTFLTNILFVIFESGTSQLERQAAIDSIHGTVVGGIRMFKDDGLYIVLVEDDHPETPGKALLEAMNIMDSLPQVRHSGPEYVFESMENYLRPDDSEGWRKGDWHLRPQDASGQNWGLERIAGPLAWGCSTGDSTLNVAVVDRGFHAVSDISKNLGGSFGLGVHSVTLDHGTEVASVLAAYGNDTLQMTGAMWRAGLHLYEAGVDGQGMITRDASGQPVIRNQEVLDRIERAARSGAHVINLSLSLPPTAFKSPDPSAPPDSLAAKADSALVRRVAGRFGELLAELDADGIRPLVVIAAGNGNRNKQGIDAYWAGYPAVRERFSDRVLVVAASDDADQLATFSNRGSLVEVAAPGVGIYKLNGDATITPSDGTSYAAPSVSGVAGLLKSFDPSLTAAQLKEFIVEGARRGNRRAEGKPILNAYESLRAVAEEGSAPLCGNDVWAAGEELKALRGETIVAIDSVGSPIGQVEVLHGGKFIHYITPQSSHTLQWDPETGTWGPGSLPADWSELRGGTLASVFGFSHAVDTFAYVDASVVSTTPWFLTGDTEEAPVYVDGGGGLHLAGRITVNDLPEPVQETCLERSPAGCHFSVIENRTWIFRLGYPQFPGAMPDERQAYVTVGPMHHVEIDSTPWAPCSFDPAHECRAVLSLQDQTETLVYRMDLAAQDTTPMQVAAIPDETVFWIGEGENGEELVLARGRWRITFWADAAHYYQTGDPFYDFSSEVERCVIEYRERADFLSIKSTVTALDACNFGLFDRPSQGAGGGTIAPSLVPIAMAPRSSIAAAEGGVSVKLPTLDPTGQEVRAYRP